MDTKKLFVNVDINSVTFPFLNALAGRETLTREDFYPFVDQYASTQVTDLLLDVFCQISVTPTGVMSFLPDLCDRKEMGGETVDFLHAVPGPYSLEGLYCMHRVHHIDPFAVWFERAREKGLRTWLSVRMNDCHEPGKVSWLHGDLYYEAIEKGWIIGTGWHFNYCLNYDIPEVRRRMLDYTKEQLMRYDTDGLELDFSREWYCFPDDGREHDGVMTQFLRDMQKVVRRAEAKWGHTIQTGIRLIRDIKGNKALGFDVDAIVGEKLADVITVCPRWATCDSDMPIGEWKAAYPGTEILAGVTDLIHVKPPVFEAIAGYASQYLHQGADGIYLYNFFNNPVSANESYAKMYRTFGSQETLSGRPRRYIVTYQDLAPYNTDPWKPLPAPADGFALDVSTGPVSGEDPAKLILGTDREIAEGELTVRINGHTAAYSGPTRAACPYTDSPQTLFTLPAGALDAHGKQRITVSGGDGITLTYLELAADGAL